MSAPLEFLIVALGNSQVAVTPAPGIWHHLLATMGTAGSYYNYYWSSHNTQMIIIIYIIYNDIYNDIYEIKYTGSRYKYINELFKK